MIEKKLTQILRLFVLHIALILSSSYVDAGILLQDSPLNGVERELGYIKVTKAVDIAYVVYKPSGDTPLPAVAWFDVYGAGSLPPMPLVKFWLDAGYAFVGGSVRGTGCSTGDYIPFNGLQDAKDGAAFIDWIGAQSWSTGLVGLIGNSQAGILQYGIAAQKPQHLVAIAPGGSVSRSYADTWYLGGIYNASLVAVWSEFSQPGASFAAAESRIELGDTACEKVIAKIKPNGFSDILKKQPMNGEYYQQSSPWFHVPNIKIPTLIVQSWTDPIAGSSALWNFERLAAKNKRMFVTNGGHEAYLYSTAHEEVRLWMDRWVKLKQNGVESLPKVRVDFEVKVDGEDASYGNLVEAYPGWTENLSDWPAPGLIWRDFYLGNEGKLLEEAEAGVDRYFYPAGSELPGSNQQFSVAAPSWASLTYRTESFAADTAVMGSPKLVAYLSSQNTDTDMMVILHDVSPDGSVTYLQRAYLRASHRALENTDSSEQYAFHPHTRATPMKRGRVYPIEISLMPMAHLVRKGHSLELFIGAPSAMPSPAWGLTILPESGFNTLHRGKDFPSRLELPIVPSIVARSSLKPCGELLYQPCRQLNGQ